MKGIELLFATPFAALAVFLAACASAPPAPTPAQKSELAPTGTLRVAVFTGNPVLGTADKASGEVSGTTAAWDERAQATGVPVKVIGYSAIAKMVEDAKTGEWDVAVVAFDPARKNVVDFAPPHIVVDLTYLVAPGSTIRSVPEADKPGVNIAAAKGAATTLFLERTLKSAKVVQADNEPAAFGLIKDGRAQVYAQNRYMLLGLADGLPGARARGPFLRGGNVPGGAEGTRRGARLRERVRRAVEAIGDGAARDRRGEAARRLRRAHGGEGEPHPGRGLLDTGAARRPRAREGRRDWCGG
jgi:polar amino acid transport system substrate-binding protein